MKIIIGLAIVYVLFSVALFWRPGSFIAAYLAPEQLTASKT